MPLGQREDYADARFCGLVVGQSADLHAEVHAAAQPAGFDFLAAPLTTATSAPDAEAAAVVRADVVGMPDDFGSKLVAALPAWLHLAAADDATRHASVAALRAHAEAARFYSIQALLVPCPAALDGAPVYGQVCCPRAT